MNRPIHLIEYGALRVLAGLVSALPLGTALGWGEKLGAFIGTILRNRARLIVANLTAAFPGKSAPEIRAVADGVWRNLGRVAVEFIHARQIVPDPLGDAHQVENFDVVRAAFAEKRGVIMVAAHYCNWEIDGIIVHRLVRGLGAHITAIARPMKNPLVEAWVQSRRSSGGVPVILHRQAVKASLRALRRGEAIGILIDQNLYQGGVFVNFFGRPAATTPLPALLHSRTGSPVILTHARRENGRFCVGFERVSMPEGTEDQRLVAGTQAINDRLEAVIRARPEWWFWIHNRWKRSAEAPAAKTASA